ncbi:MAG: hypothetical protein HQL40_02395 [Alphaproteobacteria bacterium]|nr:hypothetical protein [Alphaproteobacteria bacterium]
MQAGDPPGCLVGKDGKVLNQAFLVKLVGDSVTMRETVSSPKFHPSITGPIDVAWDNLRQQVASKLPFDRIDGKAEATLTDFSQAVAKLLSPLGGRPVCHVRVAVVVDVPDETDALRLAGRLDRMALHGVVVQAVSCREPASEYSGGMRGRIHKDYC